ncbi:MAG: flavodoxin family protein [Candidatus Firestonebacteria bacterium]
MRILAVMGSPRKNGITSTLANEILEGARENHHSPEVLYLSELKLADCRGCMSCREESVCIFRGDDIGVLEEAVKRADLLILASPVHWGNISGLMLKAIERLFGFFIMEQPLGFPVKRNGKGKKAILVTSCSTPFPFNWIFNQTRSVFSRFNEICKYSGIRIINKLALPGTLTRKEVPAAFIAKARKIGKNIK